MTSKTSALRLAYEYSMEQRLYQQAIFYAERMQDTEREGERSSNGILNLQYLLALALYHDHQIARAYYLLQGCLSSTASWTHPARHLLAQCCEILSRFEEGIRALVLSYDDEEGTLPLVIANGAAGAFLLGQLYEKNAQYHLALPAYEKSLEAGPVMFAAYERIISLRRRGVGADSKGTAEVFLEPEACFGVDRLNSWYTSASTSNTMIATADSLISDQRIARRPPPPNQASSETITVSHNNNNNNNNNNSSMIPSTVSMRGLQSTRKGAEEEQEMKSPGRRHQEPPEEPMVDMTVTSLAKMLQSFAYLYKATAHLDLPSARMVTSDRMTPGQRDSRYTTLRLAEAAFDRGEYEEAEAFFDALFTTYAFAIEGVGKYSTLLWHEKRKRALVDLSRRVLTFGRLRSESWICAANADSINLDHAEARQKLEKARLLNPCDANVCCLIGHELSSMEQFEQAAFAYSLALKRDPTAYAAWFGISQLCRRQDRFDEAESYLRKAIEVNPYHPVLKVALASLLSSRDRTDESLSVLESVCGGEGCSRKNGPHLNAFYEKSRLLAARGRIDEAIEDARKVVEVLPNENAGHALLGQLLARSGNNDAEALEHLNLALEPPGGCGLPGSAVGGPADEITRNIIELINNLSSVGGGVRKSMAEIDILQENRQPCLTHQRLRFNSLSSAATSDQHHQRLSLSQRRSDQTNDEHPQRMSIGSSMLDSVVEEDNDDDIDLSASSGRRQTPNRISRTVLPRDPFAPAFYRLPTPVGGQPQSLRHPTVGGQLLGLSEGPDHRRIAPAGSGIADVRLPVGRQREHLDIQRPSGPPPGSSPPEETDRNT